MLKVKTLSPRPWGMTKGGIEVQIEKTTQLLNNLEVDASYFHFYDQNIDFDLLHLFAADFVFKDIAKLTKGMGKKLAVSSIYYTEYPKMMKLWMKTFDPLIWRSYFGMKKYVMQSADIVLPNSYAELEQMNQIFGIPSHKMRVIPNGVDKEFEHCDGDLFYKTYGMKDFVLCVTRLDSRKNIHKLIEAIQKTDLQLVIVGMRDHNKSEYGDLIDRLIAKTPDQVKYIGPLPHDSELFRSAYGACSIHALTSRLETPGLCNLEAGLAGKKVVVSDLSTIREYLDDYAYYCKPTDVESIRKALLNAASSAVDLSLQTHIKEQFLWEVVAQKTKAAYEEIL